MRKNRLSAVCLTIGLAAFAASPAMAGTPHGKAHARPVRARHATAAIRKLSPLTPAQLARLVLPSVVRLTVLDASGQPSVQGSGFVVGPNLIATNVHVIKGAHAVTANFLNGRSESVFGVVNIDNARDLVLLYANTNGVRALPLMTDDTVQVGDPVVAVGSPEGLGGSISTGIISQMRREGDTKYLQTTAPISHGSSGGALVDMYGRVLGVTSLSFVDGQNLNFAYASYYVQKLLPHSLPVYMSWGDMENYAKSHPSRAVATAPANQSPAVTSAPVPPDNSKAISALTEDIAQTQTQIDSCNADIASAGVEETTTQSQITTIQQDALQLDAKWRNLAAQADADHSRSLYANQIAQQAQAAQQQPNYGTNDWTSIAAGAAAGARVGSAQRDAMKYINRAVQESADADGVIQQERSDLSQIDTLKASLQAIEVKTAGLRDKLATLQAALDTKNQSLKELTGK